MHIPESCSLYHVDLVILYHCCLRQEPDHFYELQKQGKLQPKSLAFKKGQNKVVKKPTQKHLDYLYRENGKEEFCTNAVSTSTPTATDFQINVIMFQHFWAAAWTTWKGGSSHLVDEGFLDY